MNKVILIGRLTRDPEIRYSQSGESMAIAHYTVAVNRRMKRENEPDADFIPCVSFGKLAEFMEKYFKKGMQIAVTGRLSVRSWDDPQTNQRRWTTEVLVDDQEFTESRAAYESRGGSSYEPRGSAPAYEQRGGAPAYEPRGGGAAYEPRGGGAPRQQSPQYQQPQPPPPYEPDGFSAIADTIDEDDLPF